jgi:hypothetical protein
MNMVDVMCDTKDLIVDGKDTKDVEYSKDESKKDAQNDNNNINKCEEVKEQSQSDLSKMFVRPWEELSINKYRHGLGYDISNNFHIPNYSKPIHFVCSRFHEEVKNITNKCQHCHRFGHLESRCFYPHYCLHCGKKNHFSEKCHKKKKVKQTINYG